MQYTLTLSARIDFGTLQALLPALLSAQACSLEASAARLQLQVNEERAPSLQRDVTQALGRLGLSAQWRQTSAGSDLGEGFHALDASVLTLIAVDDRKAPPDLLSTLAEWDAQLLALRQLSAGQDGRPRAVELYLDGLDLNEGRAQIPALADRWGVDLCLQPAADKRPRRRLVVFDMDSTLIACEVIDELAARAGVGAEVAAITERAMRGELDFRSSFRERMARLEGLPRKELDSVAATLPIMPGAARLLRSLSALGHHTAILSGGFDFFARRLQEQLGVSEVHANRLQISGDRLTGQVAGDIVDGERKVELLRAIAEREGFAMADTVAVGDGANDLPMLTAAGIGVAYHAKPLVRQRAPCAVSRADLSALLYVLGVAESC